MLKPSAGDDLAYTGVVATVFGTFVRPWWRGYKKRRSDRQIADEWFHGSPGVKGITAATLSAPERLANVEKKIDVLVDLVKSIDKKISPNGGDTNNLGDIAQRRAKQDGTWLDEPKEHR